jgi:hypothetical protein
VKKSEWEKAVEAVEAAWDKLAKEYRPGEAEDYALVAAYKACRAVSHAWAAYRVARARRAS